MFLKKIFFLGVVFTLATSSFFTFAAPKTTAIETIKLPNEITLYKGNQKALFMGENGADIPQTVLNRGFLGADTYQFHYKVNETYKYGVVADIRFGVNGLRTLGIEASLPNRLDKKNNQSSLPQIAAIINSGQFNLIQPYRMVTLMTVGKNNSYSGILEVTKVVGSVAYTERLHAVLYDSPYYGEALRIIAVQASDDGLLWPLVEPLAKVYK